MFKIGILLLIIIISLLVYCCTKTHFSVSHSVFNNLLRIHYDGKILNNTPDCPICQITFKDNDELITLPCDPRYTVTQALLPH